VPTDILSRFDPSLRLNIHPSLLPKYRGAAPIQRTLINDETLAGVSILQMEDVSVHGFDAGPVWAQRGVDVPPHSTYASLEKILARHGGELLVDFLRRRATGDEIRPSEQDHKSATKARMIVAETARIKWDTWDALKIERIHRAIGHQRALYTNMQNGTSVKLLDVTLGPLPGPANLRDPGDATYDPNLRALLVRCAGDSLIQVANLQTENRKHASAHDWWNGVHRDMLQNKVLQFTAR